jgi:hypothetical protein
MYLYMYMISHFASYKVHLIVADDQTWQTRFLTLPVSSCSVPASPRALHV